MTGSVGFPLSYATASPNARSLVARVENLRGGNGLDDHGTGEDSRRDNRPNESAQRLASQIETRRASDRYRPQHFAPFVAQVLAQTLLPGDGGASPTRAAYSDATVACLSGLCVDQRL